VPDDHEWPGDNWDHTPKHAQGNMSQEDVNSTYVNGLVAWRAYNASMPWADSVPSDVPWKAGNGLATFTDANGNTELDYHPNWYKINCGLAELFFIDCIGGKHPLTFTPGAAKKLIGNAQLQWLKDSLSASTAEYKCIVNSKVMGVFTPNYASDSWHGYQTQALEILDYIENNNIRGVIWANGDSHNPFYTTGGRFGDTRKYAGITPGAVSSTAYGSIADDSGYVYPARQENTLIQLRSIGVIDFNPSRITARIIDVRQRTIFRGTILPDTNVWDDIQTLE